VLPVRPTRHAGLDYVCTHRVVLPAFRLPAWHNGFFLRKIAPVSEVVLSVWADMVGRVATSTVGCSERTVSSVLESARMGRPGSLVLIGSRSQFNLKLNI
jgi:hypothetical protein